MGKIIIDVLGIEYPHSEHSEYYKEWLGNRNPYDELTIDLLYDFALFVSTKLSSTNDLDLETFYNNEGAGYQWFVADLSNIIDAIEDVIYYLHEDIHKKVKAEQKKLMKEAVAIGDGGVELQEAEILLSLSYLYDTPIRQDTPNESAQ